MALSRTTTTFTSTNGLVSNRVLKMTDTIGLSVNMNGSQQSYPAKATLLLATGVTQMVVFVGDGQSGDDPNFGQVDVASFGFGLNSVVSYDPDATTMSNAQPGSWFFFEQLTS